MGQVVSYLCECCRCSRHDEDDGSPDASERTRLLTSGSGGDLYTEGGIPDDRHGGDSFEESRGRESSVGGERPPVEANAEQSALSKILHDAAHELIDVSGAALQSSNLEYHEFAERAQDYSSKLILAAPALAVKFNGESCSPGRNWTNGLSLINSESEGLIHEGAVPSYEDIDLLNTLSDKVNESIHNMRKLPEGLVVPFGNAEE